LIARSRPAARLLPAATALAVFFIIACAAAVRLVPLLHGQPGGLYPDEASEGISALRILADPAYRPVFIDENGGREALFAYLVAVTFHFVTGPTVVGIRATSTVVGLPMALPARRPISGPWKLAKLRRTTARGRNIYLPGT